MVKLTSFVRCARFLSVVLVPATFLLATPACGDDDDTAGTAGTSVSGSSGSAGSTQGASGTSGTSGGGAAGTSAGSSGSSGTAGTGGASGTSGASGASGASGQSSAQSDSQLAGVLSAINSGEVMQGQLAATKGKSSDVSAYGTMMVSMHNENESKLTTILQNKGLTLADSSESQTVKSKGAAVMTQLNGDPAMSTAFDSHYVPSQITGHQDALDLLDHVLLPKVQDTDLKAHFTTTRADVVMHLEKAQTLGENTDATGGASGSAGSP